MLELNKPFSPFFVTGVPKSGTTWLGMLLDAHPEICCKGEACVHVFIKSLIKISNEYNEFLTGRATQFSESNEFPKMKAADAHAIARFFVEQRLRTIADPNKLHLKFLGEKDPAHTVNFPILNSILPAAKIVHIIRDGRATAISAWHHNMRIVPDMMKKAGFDAFLDEAAGRWGKMLRAAREQSALLGPRYLEVRYESLIDDTISHLMHILAFLGADTDITLVRTCVDAASFEKLSNGRAQGQEDSQSFFRKGTADDWKTQMTPSQIQRFNARSGGMLEELGYLSDS